MKKVAIILAGSGVYDGSEIQEVVFALLHLAKQGVAYTCFAPNKNQYHVINHATGEVMNEQRNVMVESARISRGEINDLTNLDATNFDGLLVPGGFGAAKNLNQWAIKGADGDLDAQVANAVTSFHLAQKPILCLCMGPTVVAQSLSSLGKNVRLTVGNKADSPYDVGAINEGLKQLGAVPESTTIKEISIDKENKIVSAPCYMLHANIAEVEQNIADAVAAFVKL